MSAANALNAILEPIRKEFESPERQELLNKAYPAEVSTPVVKKEKKNKKNNKKPENKEEKKEEKKEETN